MLQFGSCLRRFSAAVVPATPLPIITYRLSCIVKNVSPSSPSFLPKLRTKYEGFLAYFGGDRYRPNSFRKHFIWAARAPRLKTPPVHAYPHDPFLARPRLTIPQ